MRAARKVGALAFAILAWVACNSDYGDQGSTGDRLNPCYPNGTCNAGLVCVDEICVRPGEGPDGGAPGEDGSVVPEAATLGDGTTTASLAPEFLSYLIGLCTRLERCGPNGFAVGFDSVDACVGFFAPAAAVPYPGLGIPSPDELSACLERLATTPCAVFFDDIAACQFTGTRKTGEPCNIAGQCEGGACRIEPGKTCGVCAARGGAGATCAGKSDCQLGFYCSGSQKTCAQQAPNGGKCALDPASCAPGLLCLDDKCSPAAELAADCADDVCRSGLECVEGKCVEPGYALRGESCGPDLSCGATDHCVTKKDVATGTCGPVAKEGEECAPDVPERSPCGPGLTCVDKKCVPVVVCN